MRHHKFSDDAQNGKQDQPRSKKNKNNSEIAPSSNKKDTYTHSSPLPTWGQIKNLTTKDKKLLQHTSQPQTSEALFLALITILSCQVCGTSGKTY
jgi:hypothetical protein